MRYAVYVIGPPGVGKTTYLQKQLREEYHVLPPTGLFGLLKGEPLVSGEYGLLDGVHLGITRPGGFSGTDALSMGVQSDAVSWARSAEAARIVVYGEGQRLGNIEFLTALARSHELVVVYLTAPPEVLDQRCDQRGSEQSATWRKGAATRAARCADRCQAAGIRVVTHDTTEMSL